MATVIHSSIRVDSTTALEERLERGELLYYPRCLFQLPEGDDREFLFAQKQSKIHKNISLDPYSGRLSGYGPQTPDGAERLRSLLQSFGKELTLWLAQLLPRYSPYWQRDRITLRPEEEAIRPLRLNARNDLLHLDAFPTRPSHGARILRVYANINCDDPRMWMTSETFAELFAKYGDKVGWPGSESNWRRHLGPKLLDLFRRGQPRCAYDTFMLRFHNFLKSNDRFQERSRKTYWKFPPNSVWLAFTDTLSHAVLRGRFALEHSFFVPRSCLLLPDEAPIAIFERGRATLATRRAA